MKFLSIFFFVSMLLVSVSEGAVSKDFSIYQKDIINRHPFGKPAPPPVVSKITTEKKPDPPPAILNDLKLVLISNDPRTGIRAGIVNIKKKPRRNYHLRIGQTEDELTLLSVDPENQKAVVRYRNHEKELFMRGGSGGASGSSSPAASSLAAVSSTDKHTPFRKKGPTRILSYRERLKQRVQMLEERRQKAEASKFTKEELQGHLKEYQMDLIRAKGKLGPPLPIPLTREMDDKLVEEGVLDPQE